MKKFIIFLTIWIALISVLYVLHSDVISKENDESKVTEEVNNLYEKFGLRLIKAFYSIDELRPFSIVQVDKIIDLYNKNEGWLPPDILASKLNKKEINFLIGRVVEYIESFSPENRKVKTLNKLSNWCKANSQFEFLVDIFGVDENKLKDLIHKLNVKKGFDTKYFDTKSISSNELTSKQKKFVYYQTINLLASMKMKQQFNYYTEIYSGITKLCVK